MTDKPVASTSRPPLPTRAERYDAIDRVYNDERFYNGHSTLHIRDFIIYTYQFYWSGRNTQDEWKAWTTPRMGWHTYDYGWRRISREDAPRYFAPPNHRCDHIMVSGKRPGERCGRNGNLVFTITDPATGVWRWSEWCSKHVAEGRTVKWREDRKISAANPPVPHPNVGGILPCYLALRDDRPWDEFYEWASPKWKRPAV